MIIKFNLWSAEEIIQAYINFILKKNSKEIFINYISDKYGLKETLKGKIEINDKRLKDLPKKIQHTETSHHLELFQENWKIDFRLKLIKDNESEYKDDVELIFDESLKKEIYIHFKEFEPIEKI